MNLRLVSIALCSLSLLAACSPSQPGGAPSVDDAGSDASSDAGSDAGSDADSGDELATCPGAYNAERAIPSPDGQGWCCLPQTPTCDCGYVGGFVRERCDCDSTVFGVGPGRICDAAPPDWIASTDEHGCNAFEIRFPPTVCCNCPDAGAPDAGL